MRDWIGMVKRGIRKPPRVILARIVLEVQAEFERFRARSRASIALPELLRRLQAESESVDGLWTRLAARPFAAQTTAVSATVYDECCPGDRKRILAQAEDALAHSVDMLGSGPISLGTEIDWLVDFRSGKRWPPAYFRDVSFYDTEGGADVKVPWELSRLQWLVPVGQAYLFEEDERYAEGVRAVLESWIANNPYSGTVNWASPMEVSLRFVAMAWLFHVFHGSSSWRDPGFRERFLRNMYLHADFVERNTAGSETNSGSYTVNAAGLVFAGLFFGNAPDARRWLARGWSILCEEIALQVHSDGVDFEGSTQYHRLGAEFFLLPALYRLKLGLTVDAAYEERLVAMACFAAAYTRPDGESPLLGDAGDTRALPFGGQGHNDHRQLIGIVGGAFRRPEVVEAFHGPRDEVFWWLGEGIAKSMPTRPRLPNSAAFHDGGYFVMRGAVDHIFIDCAPVGLKGKGGHGHNDCLSFEATLDGVPLISDCGTYVYTGSFAERNQFRSTASHNTPQIDGEEINRMPNPEWLWRLENDAIPGLVHWESNERQALFIGHHSGYQRLTNPVTVIRSMLADFERHCLLIEDRFDGAGDHAVSEPLHLAPGVAVSETCADGVSLEVRGKRFRLRWLGDAGYGLEIQDCRISPSYGVAVPSKRLAWRRNKGALQRFSVFICPEALSMEVEPELRRQLQQAWSAH